MSLRSTVPLLIALNACSSDEVQAPAPRPTTQQVAPAELAAPQDAVKRYIYLADVHIAQNPTDSVAQQTQKMQY